MKRRLLWVASSAVALAAVAGFTLHRALANGIPQTGTLAYTGTLLNNGAPDNSSHFIIVKLWVAGDGGSSTPACSTIPTGNTQLAQGRFTIPLDPSCVSVIHQNPDVQVEVVVDGTSMGKAPISAVPYAVEAETASNFAPNSNISQLVPPGSVMAFAGVVGGTVNPPSGWLLCDGSAVSRTTYAALFASIGTTAGSGDGATTFNVPDYRGYFLRGVDHATGHDPNAGGRIALSAGGNAGDAVGSLELTQLLSHSHGVNDPGHAHGVNDPGHSHSMPNVLGINGGTGPGWGTNGGSYAPTYYVNGTNSSGTGISINGSGTGISIQVAGGSESRPPNVAVNYIIKD